MIAISHGNEIAPIFTIAEFVRFEIAELELHAVFEIIADINPAQIIQILLLSAKCQFAFSKYRATIIGVMQEAAKQKYNCDPPDPLSKKLAENPVANIPRKK